MRTAVLISGMPRNYELGYPSHLKHIIEPFNADVFIHTWVSPDMVGKSFYNEGGNRVTGELDPNYMNRIVELYNPKSISFEHLTPESSFYMPAEHHAKMFPSVRLYAHWSMFYGMYRSWMLMENFHAYESFNHTDDRIPYDLVFRLRFDWEIQSITFGSVNPRTIYAPNDSPHKNSFNDQFAYGHYNTMRAYMSTYTDLSHINDRLYGIVGETAVWQRMVDCGVSVELQPIGYKIIRNG